MSEKEETKEEGAAPEKSNAELIVERMEAANEKKEDLIAREEKLKSTGEIGGESDAGQTPPEKKKDSDEDYAAKVLSGDIDGKKA